MPKHKTKLTLCREAEERRIIKLGIQPRGTVQPGTDSQAGIDALDENYEPQYAAQKLGLAACGKRRRRNGWTRFLLLLRRAVER